MKHTRKSLSVLLAIVMILTSCSVCFSTFAAGSISAANRTALYNALKADGVSTSTPTVSGGSSTFYDYNGNVKKAMDAYVTVYNAYHAASSTDAHSLDYRLSTQIAEKVKTDLKNNYAADYETYNMETILNGFKTNLSPSTSTTSSSTISTATATVTIVNRSSILSYASVSAIPASFSTNIYTFTNADATYTSGSGCSATTYHYLRASANVSTSTGTNAFDKTALTALDNAWNAVSAYDLGNSDATRAALVTKTQAELTEIYDGTNNNGLATTLAAAKAAYVPAIINHFFPNAERFLDDVTFAKTIADYYPITQDITALAATDYSDYNGEQLVTLYETLNEKIESYDAINDPAVKDYLENTLHFDIDGARAKYLEIKKAYQIYLLNQLKPEVLAAYDTYAAYGEEAVSNGDILGAEIELGIGKITGYINTLTGSYDAANVAEVFGEGYVDTLRALRTNLSTLKEMAEDRVEFAAKYAEFQTEVWEAIDFDADTDELLQGIKAYDAWYANLRAFLAEIEAAYPAFYANIFSAEGERLDTLMKTRIDEKYAALRARFETAVDTAYVLYEQAQEFYGYKVTILSMETFSELRQRIGIMEDCTEIMEFLDETGNADAVSAESKQKYNKLKGLIFSEYEQFVSSGGFDKFQTSTVDDIVRLYDENSDTVRDRDYTVDDAKVLTLIDKLKAALNSDLVKNTLGLDLGKVLGEDLKAKIDDMVFTDNFINTLVQYVYPLVLNEFAKVWSDLPDSYYYEDQDVNFDLNINGLEQELNLLGLKITPKLLAQKVAAAYPDAAAVLNLAATPTELEPPTADGVKIGFKEGENPWENEALLDEDGKLTLAWGVDEAEDKKEAFLSAASAALSGLEPLLLALLANKDYETSQSVGTGHGVKTVTFLITINVNVELNLTINFNVSKNAGYNNAIIPILEAAGLEAEKIPNGNSFGSTREVLENGLVNPISALLDMLAADPIDFLLSALPNIAYAIDGQRIVPLLSELKTGIVYSVDAYAYTNDTFAGGIASLLGWLPTTVNGAMSNEDDPVAIDLGTMINLADMGLNLSSINGLLSLFKDSLPLDLPHIDGGRLATLGTLKKVDTKRGETTYTMDETGKAYTIEANKADVFLFLVDYLLNVLSRPGNLEALPALFAKEGEEAKPLPELVTTLLETVMANPDMAIAVLTELTQPEDYPLRDYDWYASALTYDVENVSASDVAYLKYGNDWTRQKAIDIVDGVDGLVDTLLPLLGKETTLNDLLKDLINGVFTNKNLTSLVGLLTSLGGYVNNETLSAILKDELGVDLAAWENAFGELFAAKDEAADETADEVVYSYNGVSAAANGEGFQWALDGVAIADGDRAAWLTALSRLTKPLNPVLELLLNGEDVTALDAVTVKGYQAYDNSLGVLCEALGIDVLTPAQREGMTGAEMLAGVLSNVNEWLDDLLAGNTVKKVLTLLPNLVYFLESNGLSTALFNLLHPVLVVLDVVRPLYDVDLNAIISEFLTDKNLNLNLENLRLTELLAVVDNFLGTDLRNSTLATYTIPALSAGRTAYSSVSGKTAYKASMNPADALTILLSGAVEALLEETAAGKSNAELLLDYLDNDTAKELYPRIVKLLYPDEIAQEKINWTYMYDGEVKLESFEMPAYSDEALKNYLLYSNAWTEDLAGYLDENLDEIVTAVLDALGKDGNALTTLLQNLLNNKVYTQSNIDAIVDLLESVLGDLNEQLLATIDVLLETNLRSFSVVNIPAVSDKESFISALETILAPLHRLVNFIFFGDGYDFFYNSKGSDLISLSGGNAYDTALVPVLEALGAKPESKAAFLNEDGETYDAGAAISSVLNALTDRLDEIAADPLNEALKLLPNVLYFLNANGVKAVVNNTLAPFDALVRLVTGKDDGSLLGEFNGVDLMDLTMENLLTLLENVANIEIPEKVKTAIAGFYIGEAEYFDSANGLPAFRLVYPEGGNARRDMLTILASVLLEVLSYKDNITLLKGLLGEDNENIYQVILNMLNVKRVAYRPIDWLFTEDADKGIVHSGMETSKEFPGGYGELFTQEKAADIMNRLDDFIDDMLQLIGVQINGRFITSVDDLLDMFVGESIYTYANAEKVLDVVKGAVAKVDTLPASDYIKAALNAALGVDLKAYDTLTLTAFDDGDRDAFLNALYDVLRPLYRALTWVLCDDDISFFTDSEGKDQITLLGAEGYKYGIAPILEALDVKNIPTQAALNATKDVESLIGAIANPLLDRVDEILAAPVDQIFEILPEIAYFINSYGLDTSIKNLLNAVYTLIDALSPLGISFDIYDVLNIQVNGKILRLDDNDFNMQFLLDLVVNMISSDSSVDLDTLIFDAVAEMTTGTVVSYDSMTGFDAYKMVYRGDETKADTVTILLRFALRWLVTGDNPEKLKTLLREKVEMTEDQRKYVESLIDVAARYAGTDTGMDTILHSLYYIYVGLSNGAARTTDWLTDYNAKVQLVKESLGDSRDEYLIAVGALLDYLYTRFVDGEGTTGNVFTEDGLATNGFLALIRQVIEWIRGIFAKLFGVFGR